MDPEVSASTLITLEVFSTRNAAVSPRSVTIDQCRSDSYPYRGILLTDHLVGNPAPHQPAKVGVVLGPRDHRRRMDPVNDRVRVGGGHHV